MPEVEINGQSCRTPRLVRVTDAPFALPIDEIRYKVTTTGIQVWISEAILKSDNTLTNIRRANIPNSAGSFDTRPVNRIGVIPLDSGLMAGGIPSVENTLIFKVHQWPYVQVSQKRNGLDVALGTIPLVLVSYNGQPGPTMTNDCSALNLPYEDNAELIRDEVLGSAPISLNLVNEDEVSDFFKTIPNGIELNCWKDGTGGVVTIRNAIPPLAGKDVAFGIRFNRDSTGMWPRDPIDGGLVLSIREDEQPQSSISHQWRVWIPVWGDAVLTDGSVLGSRARTLTKVKDFTHIRPDPIHHGGSLENEQDITVAAIRIGDKLNLFIYENNMLCYYYLGTLDSEPGAPRWVTPNRMNLRLYSKAEPVVEKGVEIVGGARVKITSPHVYAYSTKHTTLHPEESTMGESCVSIPSTRSVIKAALTTGVAHEAGTVDGTNKVGACTFTVTNTSDGSITLQVYLTDGSLPTAEDKIIEDYPIQVGGYWERIKFPLLQGQKLFVETSNTANLRAELQSSKGEVL